MKKIIYIFLHTFFLFSPLFVYSTFETDVSARIAGFFPESKRYRNLYEVINPSFQLESSTHLAGPMNWWNNFSFLYSTGETDPFREKLYLQLYTIGSGLKFETILIPATLKIHYGAGPFYAWIKEKCPDSDFMQCRTVSDIGAIFKFDITREADPFVAAFFIEYQFLKWYPGESVYDSKINLSGLYLGYSLGLRF